MRRILLKYSHILTTFAIFMTAYVENRSCVMIFHQSKLPESAKKLRKL